MVAKFEKKGKAKLMGKFKNFDHHHEWGTLGYREVSLGCSSPKSV